MCIQIRSIEMTERLNNHIDFEIQIEIKSDASKRFSYGFDVSNTNFFKQEFEENGLRIFDFYI